MQSRSLGFGTGRPIMLAVTLALGACASRPAPVAVAALPPPLRAAAPAVPMPAGAQAGMTIPDRLPDGTYATPNRALGEAATIWHLRAGLNVAALACRSPDAAAIVARYNAVLVRQRGVLRDAEARLAGEYRAVGGAEWRSRYDSAMTSLYNFFSQSFARDAFCDASARILADAESVDPAAFPAFAAARLPQLDAVFADFYRRYDAWRVQSVEPRIELGPVAALPDPSGREFTWSATPPLQLAAAGPGS